MVRRKCVLVICGGVDPGSEERLNALREWERKGFIGILREPRECEEKEEVCLKLLKVAAAVEESKGWLNE